MPQYQGVWSLQQQMQALTSGQWATDPLFDYTTLLLQADDAANSAQNNTFLDSSTNAFAITRNGNTTQGTFSPFSATGWGNYFVEANNDYLTTNSSASFGISGDFTYEGWVYLTSTAFKRFIMPSSVSMNVDISQVSSGNMRLVFFDGTTVFNDDINTFPINTWVHVAVVRSGSASNNCAFYVNGVRGTQFTTNATNSTVSITIGRYSTNGFDGYISNLRFCKSAVYSGSSFAPPTSPLTTTSQGATNCVLLTCQSNRFVDNSATAATITPTGTPSVQAFSPFAPQFQYTASGTGGSGYFDGTTDYLSVANNTALELGSSDFTIECWLYPTGGSGTGRDVICKRSAGSAFGGYSLYLDASNNFGFVADDNTSTPWAVSITGTAVTLNQWTHIAVTRSGSTWTLWRNGVSAGTATSSITINTAATSVGIGAVANGDQPFTGYISGARIVKGTAVYTAAFTPPTAPPTAITNTSLLLNYTNAGILDGTMKNNLETVGGASVSTSVVKYGSGSLYFDGTGDYLVMPESPNWHLGSTFTIEAWIYPISTSGYKTICAHVTSGWYFSISSGRLESYDFTVNKAVNSATSSISTNVWQHVALVCNAGTAQMYINGTASGSAVTGYALSDFSGLFYVGEQGTNNYVFNGYMDDLRVTKGIARYTQNFIPPSVALPRQ
jgi:hypothetical protein